MDVSHAGALCFGLVIGWITYRTVRRKADAATSDIAGVLGAVGGGAVTLWKDLFAWYAIGLAAGFFVYFIVGLIVEGRNSAKGWMMDE